MDRDQNLVARRSYSRHAIFLVHPVAPGRLSQRAKGGKSEASATPDWEGAPPPPFNITKSWKKEGRIAAKRCCFERSGKTSGF